MKSFKLLSIALLAIAFMACNNGGGAQQQQTAAPQPQQQVSATQQPAAPGASVAASTQPVPAAAQALPAEVTSFVNKHFPGTTVVGVETDSEYGGLEYDVLLSDGTEIDFDRAHQWESVDCKVKAVPAAIVPAPIANYVKANYQALPITKINNKRYGYEVNLSNGLELRFDANGNFAGFDD